MPNSKTSHRHSVASVLGILFLMTASCFVPSSAKSKITEAQRNERKADYIFLEALNYQSQNKADAYFSLIDHAYRLNTSDPYLAMQYGMKLIFESDDDSVQIRQGLNLIKNYVDGAPDDFYTAINYASIASQLNDRERALSTWETLYKNYPDRIEVGGMYADALTKTGDSVNIHRAIDIYNDIERMEGVNPTTTTRKMRLYGLFGDTAAVKSELHSLINASPASAEISAMAGSLYQQLDNRDSALYYFDRAVELAPNSGTARYQRALFFESIGDSARYDSELFQALELPDLEVDQKIGMLYDYVTKLYSDTLQQPRIESMFQSLVSQYPHEAAVRNLFGDYLVSIGRYPQAVEQISYAVDSDPSDVKRWQLLGSLYFNINEWDKAIETADEAIKFHPGIANLYTMASSAFIQKKDFDNAISYLRKGISVADSADVESLSDLNCALGDAFSSNKQIDSAFVYYEKALNYNPDNMLALNNCAYFLACQDKDLDRALSMIKRVIDNDSNSSTTLDTYAWVMFKRKDYAKAKELIDGAIANDSSPDTSAELLEHAGDIYFMDGEPEEALEFWRKALRVKPDDDLLKRKVKHKTFFYK